MNYYMNRKSKTESYLSKTLITAIQIIRRVGWDNGYHLEPKQRDSRTVPRRQGIPQRVRRNPAPGTNKKSLQVAGGIAHLCKLHVRPLPPRHTRKLSV